MLLCRQSHTVLLHAHTQPLSLLQFVVVNERLLLATAANARHIIARAPFVIITIDLQGTLKLWRVDTVVGLNVHLLAQCEIGALTQSIVCLASGKVCGVTSPHFNCFTRKCACQLMVGDRAGKIHILPDMYVRTAC